MRGFLAFLFLGLVALGAGAVGYNIGVSQAVTTTATATGAAVAYAGPHLGMFWFFPFGFLLFPLFLIAFFGFLGFVFGPRRRFGHGGWWGGREYGAGPMDFGPMGGRWDARRQWVADQHRRLHEEEARNAAPSSGTGTSTSSGGPTAG
jgi:hypothetical protein